MNPELMKQLDDLKAKRDAEREQASKRRNEMEASLNAKRREMKIQTVMSQRSSFTRADAEIYVDSGLFDKQANEKIPDYVRNTFGGSL